MQEILMEYRRETNGWQTFMENWWFLPGVLVLVGTSEVFNFFTCLSDKSSIYFFIASEVLLFFGGGLIARAKIPVYRSGQFFTFGIKSIPKNLAGCYRWGWRIFLFGVVLQLCLLLSKLA